MKFKFLGRLRDDEETGGQRQPQQVPVEAVRRLSDLGYAQEEIVDELRDRGYSHSEINEAINDAVRQSTVQQRTPQNQGQQWDEGYGSSYEQHQERQEQPQQWNPPEPEPEPEPEEEYEEADWSAETGITPEQEELIEIIVAEHFTEVEEEFDAVYEEIETLREELEALRDRVSEIEIRKDESERDLMQKVNEIQDSFDQSSQRIGGMERAFQQVLPSLVENVRELSSLVKEMKEE